MKIELVVGDLSGCVLSLPRLVDGSDNVVSLLGSVCDELQTCDACAFHMSGFGQDSWPTDVHTDLLVLLEQLPATLKLIADGADHFEIDMYEQGLERLLKFARTGTTYQVHCQSYSLSWKPNPATVEIDAGVLAKMLRDVLETFLSIVEQVSRNVHQHPWLQEWYQSAS